MEDLLPLIGLKLADGSFINLFEGLKPSKMKLTVVTAHKHQTRTVLDFFLRSDNRHEGGILATLTFDEKSAELVDEVSFEITAEIDFAENLFITVHSSSGNEKSAEISLNDALEKVFPVQKKLPEPEKKPITFMKIFLISLFVIIGLGLALFLAVFLGRLLSSDPPPSLTILPASSLYRLAAHPFLPLG